MRKIRIILKSNGESILRPFHEQLGKILDRSAGRESYTEIEEMSLIAVADPGFPVGGVHPLGGAWTSDAGAFW